MILISDDLSWSLFIKENKRFFLSTQGFSLLLFLVTLQAIMWGIWKKYMCFISAGCTGFGGLLNSTAGFCHSDVIRNRHWTLRTRRHGAWQSPSFFHYISVRLRKVISFSLSVTRKALPPLCLSNLSRHARWDWEKNVDCLHVQFENTHARLEFDSSS